MAKNKTTPEQLEKQARKQEKKQSRKQKGLRALYILMFSGMVASAIMYSLLISTPDTGMYVLAGFNGAAAVYFILKAIE